MECPGMGPVIWRRRSRRTWAAVTEPRARFPLLHGERANDQSLRNRWKDSPACRAEQRELGCLTVAVRNRANAEPIEPSTASRLARSLATCAHDVLTATGGRGA